jgi:hypothetical protein
MQDAQQTQVVPDRHAGRIVGAQRKATAIQRVITKMVKELHKLSQRMDASDLEWFVAYSMKPLEQHKRLHMAISPGMQVFLHTTKCRFWIESHRSI